MKLSIKQQTTIDNIQKNICLYFKIDEQEIVNNGRTENIVLARSFFFYILHYNLSMSTNCISSNYLRIPRNVYKLYAKVRHGLKYYKFYNVIYDEIMEKIKPFMPTDVEKFWKE